MVNAVSSAASVAKRRSKKKKKLGPRKAAEAFVAKVARDMMRRQKDKPSSPSVPLDWFDPETGWVDVARGTSIRQDIKRHFG